MNKNTTGAMSKRQQLSDEIRNLMQSKSLRAGDKLPSENELCTTYGMSRMTVRQGLAMLVSEGLLSTIQGKGTFVNDIDEQPRTIAVVIPSIARQGSKRYGYYLRHIGRMLSYLEEEVRAWNANVMLYIDQDLLETERQNLLNIAKRKPDGAIVCYIGGCTNIDALNAVQDAGVPLVLLDRYVPGSHVNCVSTDNFTGAYKATNLLIQNGFGPIFHITSDEIVSSTNDRLEGYQRACREHGLKAEDLTMHVPYQDGPTFCLDDATEELAETCIDHMGESFGLFAHNAASLVGFWNVIESRGLDHSKIGLACFDELPIDIPEDVFFVQVSQPIEDIARRTVQMILSPNFHNNGAMKIELEPKIAIVNDLKTSRDLQTV